MIRTTVLALLTALGLSFSACAAEAGNAENQPDLVKAKNTADTLCAACHGPDGNSILSVNPILAGQNVEYLYKQLIEMKPPAEGKPALRNNVQMAGFMTDLSLADMKALAIYYAQQKETPSASSDPNLTALGQALWRKGDFNKGIPACAGCHGPSGMGMPAQFPRLAGQYAEYTEIQLKSFRAEERNTDENKMMRSIADKLSDKQIKALGDYIAGLRTQ